MYFVRAGRGAPALVFVHGFACTHEDWHAQLTHFQRTHEVVACDLRGHGRTPARPAECSIEHYGGDVAALVNNLELSRTGARDPEHDAQRRAQARAAQARRQLTLDRLSALAPCARRDRA